MVQYNGRSIDLQACAFVLTQIWQKLCHIAGLDELCKVFPYHFEAYFSNLVCEIHMLPWRIMHPPIRDQNVSFASQFLDNSNIFTVITSHISPLSPPGQNH